MFKLLSLFVSSITKSLFALGAPFASGVPLTTPSPSMKATTETKQSCALKPIVRSYYYVFLGKSYLHLGMSV